LKGTVRNVVDFGAFVDIGVKQDGLVHVSRMADRYVRNPFDVVSVGDVVDVTVINVDLERGRISLRRRESRLHRDTQRCTEMHGDKREHS
ncbi:MAG TPA: S1 RNA-binding domain-containing protein, partial [Anaerolineae bacterium]|nr:S1 RNA-binding domain-containing protein [Anaerolineae bacterium]